MTIIASVVVVFLISIVVLSPFAIRAVLRSQNARQYLKLIAPPFGVQLAILFMLFVVEYGNLSSDTYTLLRVFCWLTALLGPYTLQVFLLYWAPILSHFSGIPRLLIFMVISFPIALLGLVMGLAAFELTGRGLLFD